MSNSPSFGVTSHLSLITRHWKEPGLRVPQII